MRLKIICIFSNFNKNYEPSGLKAAVLSSKDTPALDPEFVAIGVGLYGCGSKYKKNVF